MKLGGVGWCSRGFGWWCSMGGSVHMGGDKAGGFWWVFAWIWAMTQCGCGWVWDYRLLSGANMAVGEAMGGGQAGRHYGEAGWAYLVMMWHWEWTVEIISGGVDVVRGPIWLTWCPACSCSCLQWRGTRKGVQAAKNGVSRWWRLFSGGCYSPGIPRSHAACIDALDGWHSCSMT